MNAYKLYVKRALIYFLTDFYPINSICINENRFLKQIFEYVVICPVIASWQFDLLAEIKKKLDITNV